MKVKTLIDKLSLVLTLSSSFDDPKSELAYRAVVIGEGLVSTSKPNFSKDDPAKPWKVWFKIDEDNWLTLGYGFSNGKWRLSASWNPSKITHEGRERILANLDNAVVGGAAEFLKSAFVRMVDLTVDIHGAIFPDYEFIDPRFRTADERYEEQGSIYLGEASGRRAILIYDKGKKEGTASASSLPWLRIETTVRPSLVNLATLKTIKNPWGSLIVIDKAKLKSKLQEHIFRAYRKGRAMGFSAQTSYTFSHNKRQLKPALKLAVADWWDPQGFWNSFTVSI